MIILDQLTKFIASAALGGGAEAVVIPNVLRFFYVENRGAAFGMLSEHRWIFMLLSATAIVLMAVYLIHEKPKSITVRIALALALGGGVGNMIDRTFRGFVIDFIDVTCIDFYVFNIADAAVCVGCGLLMLYLIMSELGEKRKKGRNGERHEA